MESFKGAERTKKKKKIEKNNKAVLHRAFIHAVWLGQPSVSCPKIQYANRIWLLCICYCGCFLFLFFLSPHHPCVPLFVRCLAPQKSRFHSGSLALSLSQPLTQTPSRWRIWCSAFRTLSASPTRRQICLTTSTSCTARWRAAGGSRATPEVGPRATHQVLYGCACLSWFDRQTLCFLTFSACLVLTLCS